MPLVPAEGLLDRRQHAGCLIRAVESVQVPTHAGRGGSDAAG